MTREETATSFENKTGLKLRFMSQQSGENYFFHEIYSPTYILLMPLVMLGEEEFIIDIVQPVKGLLQRKLESLAGMSKDNIAEEIEQFGLDIVSSGSLSYVNEETRNLAFIYKLKSSDNFINYDLYLFGSESRIDTVKIYKQLYMPDKKNGICESLGLGVFSRGRA